MAVSDVEPTTAEVNVRPMRPGDDQRVAALTLAGYDAYGSITGEYRRFLADPQARVDGCSALLVAELDGEVVGTVTYVLPGDRQWEGPAAPPGDCGFRVLAVDPGFEGRGVGRRLVESCLDRAVTGGRRRMFIISMAWMHRAHALYHGLGFSRRPDLDARFPAGDGFAFTYDLTPDAREHFPAPGAVPTRPPWFEDVWVR